MTIARRFLRNHWGKALTLLTLAAALGAVWWVLPVRPRVSRHMGTSFSFVGFADDGQTLFIRKTGSKPSGTDKNFVYSFDCGPVVVLDANTGQERASFFNENQQLERLEISPDGRWIAALLDNKLRQLKVLEVASGLEVASLPAVDENSFQRMEFQFAPDSRTLAFTVATQGRSHIVLWDLETRQKRTELPSQKGPLAFAPDSRTLATTAMRIDRDKQFRTTISLWECSTGRLLRELPAVNLLAPDLLVSELALAFNKDAKTIGVFGMIGTQPSNALDATHDDLEHTHQLIIWDVGTGSEALSLVGPWNWHDNMLAATNRPLNGWCLLRPDDGRATLLDPVTGEEKATVLVTGPYRRSMHSCMAFIGDQYDLSTARNGQVLLVEQLSYPELHPAWAWLAEKLALPDSLIQRSHYELKFLDLVTGKSLGAIANGGRRYALSPDGRRLAALNDDDCLCIWDIPPRKPLGWFLGLAGLSLMLTLGGFWWQARRRKRQAALATEAIPCGTC
jgi:WD40 repeat protein